MDGLFNDVVAFVRAHLNLIALRNHGRYQVMEYEDTNGRAVYIHEFDREPQMVQWSGRPHVYPGGREDVS